VGGAWRWTYTNTPWFFVYALVDIAADILSWRLSMECDITAFFCWHTEYTAFPKNSEIEISVPKHITDLVNMKEISIDWCLTKKMVTDFMSKPLQDSHSQNLRDSVLGRVRCITCTLM